MNLWIGIASGNRTEVAIPTINHWRKLCKVAVLSWDDYTFGKATGECDLLMKEKERYSWGKNQNIIAETIADWDAYIAGGDDTTLMTDIEAVKECVTKFPDHIIYCDVNFHNYPLHFGLPVVTRGWYEKHGRKLFEEDYIHNYSDTHLFRQAVHEGKAVHCKRIKFFHNHIVTNAYEPLNLNTRLNFTRDRELFEKFWPDGRSDTTKFNKGDWKEHE